MDPYILINKSKGWYITMKNEKFYGVVGVNAYGVYNDYEKVIESKKYIAKFRTKKFNAFENAKLWAEDAYEELQRGVYYDYEIPEITKINWCYYRRKISD